MAREDATRLCCVESPAKLVLRFHGEQSDTGVDVEATVPGIGLVSSRNARSHLAFAARLILEAASPAPSPTKREGGFLKGCFAPSS